MLQVNAALVGHFEDAARERWLRSAEAHLRQHIAAAFAQADAHAMRRGLLAALEKAKGWGIHLDVDALRFVELLAAHGGYCDTDASKPWLRAALSRRELSAGQRLDLIDPLEMQQLRTGAGR